MRSGEAETATFRSSSEEGFNGAEHRGPIIRDGPAAFALGRHHLPVCEPGGAGLRIPSSAPWPHREPGAWSADRKPYRPCLANSVAAASIRDTLFERASPKEDKKWECPEHAAMGANS